MRPASARLAGAALLLCGLFGAPVFAETDCGDLDSLAWMLGDWRLEAEGTVFTEHWHREEGRFEGRAESRKADGGERLMHEVMTLGPRDGVLTYVVDVGADGETVVFPLVSCGATSARFENPEHDFPNRLDYRLLEGGILSAAVSDLDGNGFDLEFEPVDDED